MEARKSAKRIDFTKEGPALVWEQPIIKNGSKAFVFFGNKGDLVRVNFVEDSGKGKVEFEEYSVDGTQGFEMKLPESKDYYFLASNPNYHTTSFRLSISLEPDSSAK